MLRKVKLGSPIWPFLFVFVLPPVAAMVSFAIVSVMPQCGADETWWEAKHVRLAFLPGALSLVPLGWLFSKSPIARQAGGIAGLMGASQFALPQAALAYYAAVPGAEGQLGNASCTVSVFLLPWLAPSMVILWITCVIMGIVPLRKLIRRINPVENVAY